MSLTFHPERHAYTWDGIPVPSVTQVLRGAALMDVRIHNTEAMDRGKDVHAACEFYDQRDLNWDTVRPELVGYVRGWEAFLADCQFKIVDIERMVFNPTYRYAGTLDRTGSGILGGAARQKVLLDLKTGSPARWHALQLAAYALALEPRSPDSWYRVGCYLSDDGGYMLRGYEDDQDFDVFLAATTVFGWRRMEGLVNERGE